MPVPSRRMTGVALAVCAALAMLAALTVPAPARSEGRQPIPNPLELRDLLLAQRFHEVERRLVSYQRDFESGGDTEYLAAAGYGAFATSDPAVAAPLDAWVAAMPDSWAALTARGLYRERTGWLLRGTRLARETGEKRFAGMREQFALAEVDLRAAIGRNPHITPAHAALISMAMATGRMGELEDLLAAGLEAEPASYNIRNTYLGSLEPKWGGSEAAMAAFVEASMKWLHKNPGLKALEAGYRSREIHKYHHRGRYEEARAVLDKILAEWVNASLLVERGLMHFRLRGYDSAMADYRKALGYAPHWPYALQHRARLLARLNRNDEALRDHDLAVQLEPLDPVVLKARSYEYDTQGRFREAIGDLTDALVYEGDDANIWARRGDLYAQGLRDNEAAVADFEKSLELNSGIVRTWRLYGQSLAALDKCEAIEAFRIYRQICDADKKCLDDRYESLARISNRLIAEQGCMAADG